MSSEYDTPKWVDPRAKGDPTRARFWKFAAMTIDFSYGVLTILGALLILLLGCTPEVSSASMIQSEEIIMAACLPLVLVAGLGIYGAYSSNQYLVMLPLCMYVAFGIFPLQFHLLLWYGIFAIPHAMLIREIRRGVHASAGK